MGKGACLTLQTLTNLEELAKGRLEAPLVASEVRVCFAEVRRSKEKQCLGRWN